jgi:PAS domain S-box-containing protein
MENAKILIVEDEIIVAKDLEAKLKKDGYSIADIATSGEDAVNKVPRTNPDLILMDIILQGTMTGIEASKIIKKNYDIPIIYLTASSDEYTIKKAENGAPFGYIIKPYDGRELHANIEIALLRHRLEKEIIEREDWLASAFDSIGDAVIATDRGGIIRKMNVYAETLTGCTRKESLGKKISEVFQTINEKYGEDLTKSLLDNVEDKNNSGLITTEILQSRNGRQIYIDKKATPIKDEHGRVLGVVLIFRDVTEKRKLQERILESEKKFRHIFEQSNDAVFLIENNIFMDCNSKAQKLFGMKKEEIINSKIKALFSTDHLISSDSSYDQMKKDGTETLEFTLKRNDGALVEVEVNVCPLEINFKLMELAIFHDITDRKKLEKALKESEIKYRQLVEMAEEGIWAIDENLRTTFVNPRMAGMVQYTTSDMIGKSFSSFFYPEDIKNYPGYGKRSLKKKKSIEARLIRKDGSFVYVRMTASPAIVDENKQAGFILVVMDINDMKMEEEEIRKLSYAIEQSPSSIVITDLNGNIEYVNQKFIELTGYARNELTGQNPRILKSGDTQADEYKKLWNTIINGGTWHGIFHNKKKNGELYWESALISPIKNKNGSITHYIGLKEDITDKKISEDRLQKTLKELEDLNKNLDDKVRNELQKNREMDQLLIQQSRLAAMGEMIGNIAHQWRQPINALGVIIQNIEQAYDYDKLTKKYLTNTIDKAMSIIFHMSQTIDDFRNFFRPDKEMEEFSINEAINKTISFVDSTFKDYNIMISFNAEKEIIKKGYPNEYCQVIMNLLSNVKDAVLERKLGECNVKIELSDENGRSEVTVSDDAGGINENILDRIFDPYFTTKEYGTGIGLYMSKIIIEKNMGGKLSARNIGNETHKRGTSFRIEL